MSIIRVSRRHVGMGVGGLVGVFLAGRSISDPAPAHASEYHPQSPYPVYAFLETRHPPLDLGIYLHQQVGDMIPYAGHHLNVVTTFDPTNIAPSDAMYKLDEVLPILSHHAYQLPLLETRDMAFVKEGDGVKVNLDVPQNADLLVRTGTNLAKYMNELSTAHRVDSNPSVMILEAFNFYGASANDVFDELGKYLHVNLDIIDGNMSSRTQRSRLAHIGGFGFALVHDRSRFPDIGAIRAAYNIPMSEYGPEKVGLTADAAVPDGILVSRDVRQFGQPIVLVAWGKPDHELYRNDPMLERILRYTIVGNLPPTPR